MSARTYTAFAGERRLAAGDAATVGQAVQAVREAGASHLLVFEDGTGEQAELDQRPASPTIAPRPSPSRGRGRPKLGVAAREVTLLPRHWEWLATQPGGASAALRRLVEAAISTAPPSPRAAQDATYRVLGALAGHLPGFDEVLRALYAADGATFEGLTDSWPADVRDYVRSLAAPVFTRPA